MNTLLNQQLESILEKHNIAYEICYYGIITQETKYTKIGIIEMQKFELIINGVQRGLYYYQGMGVTCDPDLYTIFEALIFDSEVDEYFDFEDWANCFGLNSDSIADKKIYDKCVEQTSLLHNILSDEVFEEIKTFINESKDDL